MVSFSLYCSWTPGCPIHHVNRAKVTTKINIFLSSLSDKIEDELEMTTVCHRPEGLEQLEAQTNFTKRELQVLYRGFKNVRMILQWTESTMYVPPQPPLLSCIMCIIPLRNICSFVLMSPTTAKWAQSATSSNIYDTIICLKLSLDEYSAYNILLQFVAQMSGSTLQFPQLCQYFKITWKCFIGTYLIPAVSSSCSNIGGTACSWLACVLSLATEILLF